MKVLLVDDHPLFVEGLKNLLVAHGIDVVGTAHDGLVALCLARTMLPDVVLMDLLMPEHDGLEGICLIKAELPDIKVVVLTMFDDSDHLLRAMRGGASGYLLKNVNIHELLDLLECASRGEIVISRDMAFIIMRELALRLRHADGERASADANENPIGRLTSRQIDILRRVAQGQTNREIAAVLQIGERTVQYHMSGILKKLNLCNRAQVVAMAQSSF
jgi:two-component system NarL family response regulator